MKNYKKAVSALILAFVLSTSVLADDGVMWTGKTPPPPPPPPTTQVGGVMWTGTAEPVQKEDILTEIVLSLLQTLVPLL